MQVSAVGLDIAKNVFQIHGVDAKGREVLRKRLRRSQMTDFFGNLPVCLIGMESTGGAHYWARVLSTFGHTVRLIAPQLVKPYLKHGAKNDANDAAAICEAVSRPNMRFVPQKTIGQQDMQCIHRVRSRLIGCRRNCRRGRDHRARRSVGEALERERASAAGRSRHGWSGKVPRFEPLLPEAAGPRHPFFRLVVGPPGSEWSVQPNATNAFSPSRRVVRARARGPSKPRRRSVTQPGGADPCPRSARSPPHSP